MLLPYPPAITNTSHRIRRSAESWKKRNESGRGKRKEKTSREKYAEKLANAFENDSPSSTAPTSSEHVGRDAPVSNPRDRLEWNQGGEHPAVTNGRNTTRKRANGTKASHKKAHRRPATGPKGARRPSDNAVGSNTVP